MKIRVSRHKINSIPSVVVYTTDWSRQDLDAILRVGEPSVDIGGKFWKFRRCDDSSDSNDLNDDLARHDRFFEPLSDTCSDDSAEGYEDTDDYFVIPSHCVKIRSEFPVMVDFGEDYFKRPELCAKLWSDEVSRRIARKVRMLRFVGTTLSGKEEVYDV